MRPYQLQVFFPRYLSANRFGGLLADDMGLGKTLQTLACFLVCASKRSSSFRLVTAMARTSLPLWSLSEKRHGQLARGKQPDSLGAARENLARRRLNGFIEGLATADLHVIITASFAYWARAWSRCVGGGDP